MYRLPRLQGYRLARTRRLKEKNGNSMTTEAWLKKWTDYADGLLAVKELEQVVQQALLEEREFWAHKFDFWEKCQRGGSTTDIIKAKGFTDCARVLRDNDRWLPPAAEKK